MPLPDLQTLKPLSARPGALPDFKTLRLASQKPIRSRLQLDPYEQAEESGQSHEMDAHDADFLAAVANDPAGFFKSLPGDIASVSSGLAALPYDAAADVVSKASGDLEYGHNLAQLETGSAEPLPVDKFLTSVSQSNPALATVGKLASGIAETAPMMLTAGLPAAMQKAIVRVFTAYVLYHLPKTAKDLYDEFQKPAQERDMDKVSTLISDGIQQTVFGGLGAAHEVPGIRRSMADVREAAINKYVPRGQNIWPGQDPGYTGQAFKMPAGATPAQREAPPAAPGGAAAAKPALSPADLQPALLVNGKPVTYGGDTHDQVLMGIVNNHNASDEEVTAAHEAFEEDANHVFVDPTGKVYSRAEAGQALGLDQPLHSERLNELKANPPTPPTGQGQGAKAPQKPNTGAAPTQKPTQPVQAAQKAFSAGRAQSALERLKAKAAENARKAALPVSGAVRKTYKLDEEAARKAKAARKAAAQEAQKRAAANAPATSFEKAQTGKPFRIKLMRGSGASKSPYAETAPQEPILGKGRWTTSSRKYAEVFGPNITEHEVNLQNPLVIRTDDQWRALTKEAGWRYANPVGQAPEESQKNIRDMRQLIEAKGHDGVVIDPSEEGDEAKTLHNVFGAQQALEFNVKWKPARAAAVEPVMAQKEEYSLADAVKEAGGLGAPELDSALEAMRKGRTAAQVVADWAGAGGEHEELAGILEEIAGARSEKFPAKLKQLRAAYQKAFTKRSPGVSDKTLAALQEERGDAKRQAPK